MIEFGTKMAIDLRTFKIKLRRLCSCFPPKLVLPSILTVGTIIFFMSRPDRMWDEPPYSRLSLENSTDLHFLPSTSKEYSQEVYDFLDVEETEHAFPETSLDKRRPFNPEGRDVMVYLYMQKTAGAVLENNLFKMKPKNSKTCYRPVANKGWRCENSRNETWLYTRYIRVPIWPCGVHADWTRTHKCVPSYLDDRDGKPRDRNYRYITMLRNPLHRYISEWSHVSRGATWVSSEFFCSQQVATCYGGKDTWKGVTLDEFMNCPYNQADNRMTWMLADVGHLGCNNIKAMSLAERDRQILKSAKSNLRKMAYFGIVEFQAASQELFENTLDVKFDGNWKQKESILYQKTEDSLSEKAMDKLIHLNKLDIELYQYAKDLFFQRLKRIRNPKTA